ncbi:MAG: phosphate acyltransferase PlsX [Simkaniaceae bacterium]
MKRPCIGIDLMGGDHPPQVLLKAVSCLVESLKTPVHFVVFGDLAYLKKLPPSSDPIKISTIESHEVIEMEDDPLKAVRVKKQASMPLGIEAIKSGQIHAFVTTGNTGALLAASKLYLDSFSEISRPALLTLLPTKKKAMAVLDVGANLTASSRLLLSFAKMGIAFQKSRGIKTPRVGLLNIGTEKLKGTKERIKAHELLLEKLPSYFVGNIEAREAFYGNIDVLVTDGFTGNVFLKASEGVAELVRSRLNAFSAVDKKAFKSLDHELDTTEYAGALLSGIKSGIIIKCHGNASSKALKNGVHLALELLEGDFLKKIKNQLA